MDLILETNGIIKKYGNKIVLNNINMKIKRGDIYGFIGKYGIGFETNMIYSIIICLIAIVVLTIFYSTIAFVLEKNLIGILTIIFLPRVIDLSFLAIYNFFKVELDSYWITGILPKFLDNPTLGNMIQPIILFIIYLIIIVFVGNRIIWRKEIK